MINTHQAYGIYEKYFKRVFDFTISLCGLIVLSPLIGVVAILVKYKLGTPVIFQQERPGKNEKIFKLYKFRTMTDQKDKYGNLLPDGERLPQFGKLLRKTSLDELPELINILKGDMSIVGPRPLLVKYLPYYSEQERHRHDVRPGLTGLAQVNGRNFIKWEDRFLLDCEYVNRITLKGDVSILFQTVLKVLKHVDVMEGPEYLDFKNLDEERR